MVAESDDGVGGMVTMYFGTKTRSTKLTSRIPMQKSKDASRTQNPAFASYLRPSEGQNLKGRK